MICKLLHFFKNACDVKPVANGMVRLYCEGHHDAPFFFPWPPRGENGQKIPAARVKIELEAGEMRPRDSRKIKDILGLLLLWKKPACITPTSDIIRHARVKRGKIRVIWRPYAGKRFTRRVKHGVARVKHIVNSRNTTYRGCAQLIVSIDNRGKHIRRGGIKLTPAIAQPCAQRRDVNLSRHAVRARRGIKVMPEAFTARPCIKFNLSKCHAIIPSASVMLYRTIFSAALQIKTGMHLSN